MMVMVMVLDVSHPVDREGSYQGETKCMADTRSRKGGGRGLNFCVRINPLRGGGGGTAREREREADRQAGRQADRQTDRQ